MKRKNDLNNKINSEASCNFCLLNYSEWNTTWSEMYRAITAAIVKLIGPKKELLATGALRTAAERWISEANHIEGIYLIVLLQCTVLSNGEIKICYLFELC